MDKKWAKRIAAAVLLLYCLGQAVGIVRNLEKYQWDFRTYYYAAKAFGAGLNPYDTNVLSQVAAMPIALKFVYSPVTLWFFRPFSLLDYNTAFYLFLVLKCLLLIGLVYLWLKAFLKGEADVLFYPFLLLAFNGTVFRDLTAGNISTLEQLLIWLGFYFYLKKRLPLFCLCILVAATFKLMPIIFLALLLFSGEKRRYRYFFASCAVFACFLLVSYLSDPTLFTNFLRNALGLAERGIVNPSTLALIRDVLRYLTHGAGTVPQVAQWPIYVAVIATIAVVSWRAITGLRLVEAKDRERALIFLACLVYALILPRFKDYSYILLLVPTYFILLRLGYLKGIAILVASQFVVTALCLLPLGLPKENAVLGFLCGYYALTLAYCVWALYLYWIFAARKRLPGRVPASPSTRGTKRPPPRGKQPL